VAVQAPAWVEAHLLAVAATPASVALRAVGPVEASLSGVKVARQQALRKEYRVRRKCTECRSERHDCGSTKLWTPFGLGSMLGQWDLGWLFSSFPSSPSPSSLLLESPLHHPGSSPLQLRRLCRPEEVGERRPVSSSSVHPWFLS
jgi:hypothetical protein